MFKNMKIFSLFHKAQVNQFVPFNNAVVRTGGSVVPRFNAMRPPPHTSALCKLRTC